MFATLLVTYNFLSGKLVYWACQLSNNWKDHSHAQTITSLSQKLAQLAWVSLALSLGPFEKSVFQTGSNISNVSELGLETRLTKSYAQFSCIGKFQIYRNTEYYNNRITTQAYQPIQNVRGSLKAIKKAQ